jgi:hypothetical protein
MKTHTHTLYQHILELQIRSVLRFYRTWLTNLSRDVAHHDDWAGIVSKVKELETTVDNESKIINTVALRRHLEALNKAAEESLESMRALISLVKEQLQVSKEHRDISSE